MSAAPVPEQFDTVARAAAALARGELIVVVDDADRENEGDLVGAAELFTPVMLNFLVTHGRGLVCVPMEGPRLDALGLPDMVVRGNDPLGTRFAVSVDLDVPGSTGISAADRAATISALARPTTGAADLRRPGHIFPLRYADGGVLVRRGHTEASIDLARIAGLTPATVICEILDEDGAMLRGAPLTDFARHHGLPLVHIGEIAEYRRRTESLHLLDSPAAGPCVERVVETRLPTAQGVWRTVGYADLRTGGEHIALVMGDVASVDAPLVRIHSECRTGDALGSRRCDCGEQLHQAMAVIAREGAGVVLHLGGHEGRGIGLLNKLRAYALQDAGRDTVDANVELGLPVDARRYDQAAAMLIDLGLQCVRLLSSNPDKATGLAEHGLEVAELVPVRTPVHADNVGYLATKRARCGHLS